MNDIPYTKTITPRTKAFVAIIGLIFIGIIIGYVISLFSLQIIQTEIDELPIQIDQSRITRSMNYYTGAMIFLSIQIMLLVGLLYVYFDSFRKTKSRFLIGLNMFIIVLFIRSILSVVSLHTIATEYIRVIPYVSRTFLTPGFSVLNYILYLFEVLALSILLYLSME
jgi:phosphoglycerol transferase MdoB-like AlkP superfamily enzyme